MSYVLGIFRLFQLDQSRRKLSAVIFPTKFSTRGAKFTILCVFSRAYQNWVLDRFPLALTERFPTDIFMISLPETTWLWFSRSPQRNTRSHETCKVLAFLRLKSRADSLLRIRDSHSPQPNQITLIATASLISFIKTHTGQCTAVNSSELGAHTLHKSSPVLPLKITHQTSEAHLK